MPNFSRLFSKIEDRRAAKKSKIAVLSLAGDKKMLSDFITTLKKQTLKNFDLMLIYPKGADFYHDSKLSIINAEERYPLGTSGCFFSGQAFLFCQGYDIIIVADLDAEPSLPNMLEILVQRTISSKKACIPVSKPPFDTVSDLCFNSNQYGTYPREIFMKAGFETPFLWRGAEDDDFFRRLSSLKLVEGAPDLYVLHPFAGFTIYHKMANRKKFYPYITGNAKALLLRSSRTPASALLYIAWYIFYRFFSEAFGDKELERAIRLSGRFEISYYGMLEPEVKIEQLKEYGRFKKDFASKTLSNFGLLASLILKGSGDVYTDRVNLIRMSGTSLFINCIKAALLIPLYFVESFLVLLNWSKELSKIIYPVKPERLEEAIAIYENYVSRGKL